MGQDRFGQLAWLTRIIDRNLNTAPPPPPPPPAIQCNSRASELITTITNEYIVPRLINSKGINFYENLPNVKLWRLICYFSNSKCLCNFCKLSVGLIILICSHFQVCNGKLMPTFFKSYLIFAIFKIYSNCFYLWRFFYDQEDCYWSFS